MKQVRGPKEGRSAVRKEDADMEVDEAGNGQRTSSKVAADRRATGVARALCAVRVALDPRHLVPALRALSLQPRGSKSSRMTRCWNGRCLARQVVALLTESTTPRRSST